MIWVAYAVIAHIGNALVFVGDKTLLETKSIVGSPAKFAAFSALVSAGAGVILPFVFAVPTIAVVGWSLVGGVFWLIALWLFFAALKYGEPSRVVPIAGSAVPVFTLLISVFYLGEEISQRHLWAVLVLIVGGILLSISFGGRRGLSKSVILMAILSGIAFASHFAIVDHIYEIFEPFLAAFAYARVGVGVASIGLLMPLIVSGDIQLHRQNKPEENGDYSNRNSFLQSVFWGSKALGTGALVLQNYAISLGSVTIVNALQGVQYLFLILFAWIVSARWPELFKEEFAGITAVQKILGAILVGGGIALLLL